MIPWWIAVILVLLGGTLGIMVMAIMFIAKENDRDEGR